MRRSARMLLLLMVVQGLAGCDGPGSSWRPPTAPSPGPQAAPPTAPISLVVFTDRETGFSTSDVGDAQEQIVRFNTAGELIWAADDTRFPGYGATGSGSVIGDGFEVRFGTRGGERRAYLTYSFDYYHYGPPAIVVDLEVVGGRLVVSNALAPVPLPGT